MAISEWLRKQAAMAEAREPDGASGSMDSTAVLLEWTPSSVLVARLWIYRPTPVAFDSAGRFSISRRRISVDEVAPITCSPSELSSRICFRSAAMRRSRNHQMDASAPARISDASSTRRLNGPAPLDHRHRSGARDQDLKISIIGRQRAVLAGDAGDADAVAHAEAAQLGPAVAPRAGQENVQLLAAPGR